MAVEDGSARSDWYYALSHSDCVEVKRLLELHPHLVMEGWKPDLTRGPDGDAGSGTAQLHWKGCTALHVAANEGYTELVTTVMNLFNVSHQGEWLLNERTSTTTPASDQAANSDTCSLADLLAQTHGLSKLEAIAMAVINGNVRISTALMEASFKCKSNPYEVGSLERQVEWWSLETEVKFREVERQVEWWKSDDKRWEDVELITEEVMGSLTTHERSRIETEYSQDAIFSGLPWKRYLFYFTFASDKHHISAAQKRFFRRISSSKKSDVFMSFLFTRDGPLGALGESSREIGNGLVSGEPSDSVGAENAPYWIHPETCSITDDERSTLKMWTEEILDALELGDKMLINMYYSHSCFNFLPRGEYIFLFTFTVGGMKPGGQTETLIRVGNFSNKFRSLITKIRKMLLERINNDGADRTAEYLRFLMLELRDGRGRTSLHIAVDHQNVRSFVELIPEGEDHKDWMNPLDGAGRTPLYRAAATGNAYMVGALVQDSGVDLNATFSMKPFVERFGFKRKSILSERESFLSKLSRRNGFEEYFKIAEEYFYDVTALEIAIIHKHWLCVLRLLADDMDNQSGIYRLNLSRRIHPWGNDEVFIRYATEPLGLAVAVGDAASVKLLLEDRNGRARDPGRPSKWWGDKERLKDSDKILPAFLLAAASGRFDMIKLFLSEGMDTFYDPFVKDGYGMTAMHYAAGGAGQFPLCLHLLHYATVGQLDGSDTHYFYLDNETRKQRGWLQAPGPQDEHKSVIERQGCVQLLLQAGFDLWTTNCYGAAPHPSRDMPSDFVSWWFDKLAKETVEEQNTLNAAANAISITATLVATASYIGPLQPPLSYEVNADGLPSEIQMHNKWVRMFFICNTLSFYLSVAAIMLSVIPTLPIPHRSIRMEIKHTRRIVTFAVGILFPSIISVILAFAGGSLAVTPNADGSLKVGTIIVGGLTCLSVIYMFTIRLLGLVMRDNTIIKKLYGNSLFFDKLVREKWTQYH